MSKLIRTVKIPLTNLTHAQTITIKQTLLTGKTIAKIFKNYYIENKITSTAKAQKSKYYEIRELYPEYPTALIQTIRDTVSESIKTHNTNHPKHKYKLKQRKDSDYLPSIRLNFRCMALRGNLLTFSTVDKRMRVLITLPTWFEERYPSKTLRSGVLGYDPRKSQAYVCLTYEVSKKVVLSKRTKVVGLDRGLYTTITTSDGVLFGAQEVRKTRRKYQYNRSKLQAIGTHSARRKLARLSGREKRYMANTNHTISKTLASDPTVSTYVLEDLKGIRSKRHGKRLNSWLGQWSYYQLELFLTYKCEARGISVVRVDPRYTSQMCSACGVIKKSNRVRNKYSCSSCGYVGHADVNAALNIRDKYIVSPLSLPQLVEQALVNEPIVTTVL